MSFCQSLNKKVMKPAQRGKRMRATHRDSVTDQLMPIFTRHRWGKDGDCTRCYKVRNPNAKPLGGAA